ncbi:hypothetical protein E4U24_005633 [Claviceps purpurea]|nr:hypothetical protein E4U24_005633 [Claviceps purpurea]
MSAVCIGNTLSIQSRDGDALVVGALERGQLACDGEAKEGKDELDFHVVRAWGVRDYAWGVIEISSGKTRLSVQEEGS